MENTTRAQRLGMAGGTFLTTWAMVQHGGEGAIIGAVLASVVASNADRIIGWFSGSGGQSPLPDGITEEDIVAYRRQLADNTDLSQETADFILTEESSDLQTFRQLLPVIQKMIYEDRNKPPLKRRLLVGYSNGKLYYTTMESLYSCGIGGTGRTGKSTTVRFLLFQLILMGFRFIMVDPHIQHADESLAYQFKQFTKCHAMPPCDAQDENLLRRVRALHKELRRRIDNGVIDGIPVLFVLDEFNGVMRRASEQVKKELADLLLEIEQEGGKFGIYVWVIGQRWAENDLGGKGSWGVAIRTSLMSKIAHRFSDETQAACFMGTSSLKQQNVQLPKGRYLFLDSDGKRMQITTPLTLAEDSTLVLNILMGMSTARQQEVHTEKLVDERAKQVEPDKTGKTVSTGDEEGTASDSLSSKRHISHDGDTTATQEVHGVFPSDWTLEQARVAKNMYQERVAKEDILKYLGKRGTASVRRGELNQILAMEI